jgi:hypothetical protein
MRFGGKTPARQDLPEPGQGKRPGENLLRVAEFLTVHVDDARELRFIFKSLGHAESTNLLEVIIANAKRIFANEE